MDITFPTKFAGQRFRRFSDLLLRAIERISKPDDDQRTTAELASMTPCESLDLDVLRANLARAEARHDGLPSRAQIGIGDRQTGSPGLRCR